MSKELEMLNQTTTVGDLPVKMEEAEAAKTEVEALLLERVSFVSFTHLFILCSSMIYSNEDILYLSVLDV